MTFLKTLKLTTLTLLLLIFTNNSYVQSKLEIKIKTLFTVPNCKCLNWDSDTQSLYFSGGYALYRYDYNEQRLYKTVDISIEIDCVLAIDSSPILYAVALERRIEIWEWEGHSENYKVLYTLFELPNINVGDEYQRFASLVADKKGRLYGGTGEPYPTEYGCLYRWEKGLKDPITLFCDISDPAGLEFDYARKKFYYSDTVLQRIDVFDYNAETGAITNPEILIDFKQNETHAGFFANGIVLDQDGNLVIPAMAKYEAIFVNPINKTIDKVVKIECKFPTAVVFGGPRLDLLFIGSTGEFRENPCGDFLAIHCLGTSGFERGKLKL